MSRTAHARRARGVEVASSGHRYRNHAAWFHKHVQWEDRPPRPRERVVLERDWAIDGWYEYSDTAATIPCGQLNYASPHAQQWHVEDARVRAHGHPRILAEKRMLRRLLSKARHYARMYFRAMRSMNEVECKVWNKKYSTMLMAHTRLKHAKRNLKDWVRVVEANESQDA
jgi:hypothetical protein